MKTKTARTGKFSPQHPEKYVGDTKNIVFRSSWELKLFKFLDRNSNVLKWGSEEFSIQYFDPVADKVRRYFPDVFVIVKTKDGVEQKVIIEVKPFVETMEPVVQLTPTGKPTKRYIEESTTYMTNTAKWDAAKKFCQVNNLRFLIMDEYALGIKRRPK